MCGDIMYLLRALNEFDINTNPINNGLASKLLIYRIVEKYYKNDCEYSKLNKQEKDLFIKEHMNDYLINHQGNLGKKFDKNNRDIRNTIESVLIKNSCYDNSYMKLVYALSTLNNHLINGSKTFTDWISLTSSFECIFPYYDNQVFHHVAVVESATNGIRDLDINTLAIDVSSKESIMDRKILCKKIEENKFNEYIEYGNKTKFVNDLVKVTKKNFMGFNFSQADEQFCYYQYIPSYKVISVLEQFQIDLIRAEIFNDKFLQLDKKLQAEHLKRLKYKLKMIIMLKKDSFMMRVFDELYMQNKNIKYTDFSLLERDRIEHNRSLILGIANKIPDIQIKRKI